MDTLKYLRIRFKHRARGMAEGDCLNLLLQFYREELGIVLEDFKGDYETDWAERGQNLFLESYDKLGFVPVDSPAYGDVVLFQFNGRVSHCGVVTRPDRGEFLHTSRCGTCIENYLLSSWAKRVYKFFRHSMNK